ncbi:ABC transporter ATP-binding protein/permease [Amylibacter sp.]|nr:ABC transporter ATP-binding protein/permease [Amylibacter sp.]
MFIEAIPLYLFEGSELFRILFVYLIIVFFASMLRILHLYLLNFVAFKLGAQLGSDLFKKVLFCKYENSKSVSSADTVVDLIPRVNSIVFGVILPLLTLTTNLIIVVVVLGFALFLISKFLMVLMISVAITFQLAWYFSAKKLTKNGVLISNGLRGAAETTIEIIKNKKMIELGQDYKFYLDIFKNVDQSAKSASARNQFIVGLPRYYVEIIIAIVITCYIIINASANVSLNRIVAELAVAMILFQRLFPIAQSIFRSFGLIKSSIPSMRDAFSLFQLNEKKLLEENNKIVKFEDYIELENVQFRYEKQKVTLNIKNIKISKGEKVILSGRSGLGKTTIIDIFMGLLQIDKGFILVDGVPINEKNLNSWQNKIEHVEQDFYIANRSVFQNICNNKTIYKDDVLRIKYLCKKLSLDNVIMTLPGQYNEKLGEDGSKLSGGERQRLMIARALFNDPEVLFFDEATSALDFDNKVRLYDLIKSEFPYLTLISITHDSREIEFFDRIIDCHQILELK